MLGHDFDRLAFDFDYDPNRAVADGHQRGYESEDRDHARDLERCLRSPEAGPREEGPRAPELAINAAYGSHPNN